MKKQLFLMGSAAMLLFAACNNSSSGTASTSDTAAKTSATTTSPGTMGRQIANFESRSFMDVKTGKPVKLKYDTVNHYYIDVTTNQQPDYYYFDPASHDTFDYYGRRLNNALIMENGDYRIDESRLTDDNNSSTTTTTDTGTMSTNGTTGTGGNMKIKQKDDMYKEKSGDSKLKVTDDKVKVKPR